MLNNIKGMAQRKPVNAKKTVIYDCLKGGRSYSHHASITYFKDKFYVMWSSGKVNEDDVGQCVMMSTSKDGEHFGAPKILFDSVENNGVLTSAGWLVRDDGKLNAYAGLYYYPEGKRPEGDQNHIGTTLICKTSSDGVNFGKVEDLKLPIIPNQAPTKLENGRIVICGNITFPYTDCCDGIHGYKTAGIPPCPVQGLQDDSEGFHIHAEMREDKLHVCEGSFFECDNGNINMLLRDCSKRERGNRHLALSVSLDGGNSYSECRMTEFSDNCSKFFCMRLKSGKWAIISNPDPIGARCPLSISISSDGENFDRVYDIATEKIPRKFEGMYKGGIYGYPHAIEVGHRIYAVCSINKEDICLFSFNEEDIK